MPYSSELFHYFQKLDNVSVDRILGWLKKHKNQTLLENELGNKILYTESLPISDWDLTFDLAILRELIRSNASNYYSPNFKKIVIPEYFLERFPNLAQLIWAFVDIYLPKDIATVLIRSDSLGVRSIGTILRPTIISKKGVVDLWIHNKKYQVRVGSLVLIPAGNYKEEVRFVSNSAKLNGQYEIQVEVSGGKAGIIVDLRD